MNKINNSVLCLLIVFVFIGTKLIAQGHLHDDEHHIKDYNKQHYHKHHIAVLNGATSNFDHHSTNYSVGIDYEYRFSQYMGVGVEGEFVAAESAEVLAGIPFFFHPQNLQTIMKVSCLFPDEDYQCRAPEGPDIIQHCFFHFPGPF